MTSAPHPAGGAAIAVHGAHAPLAATLWRGRARVNAALIVFLHGGAFISDNSAELAAFFRELQAGLPGAAILAPRYTLATERPFPAPLEDVYSVLQWSVKHKAALGWSGKTLIVAGIEAGANLAAAAVLVSRDRNGPRLAAQILLMPMLDPALASRSMRESCAESGQLLAAHRCASGYQGYLPHAADRAHPYATPLHSSRLKGLPSTLIFSVDLDPLRDEADAYGEKLAAQGVPTSVVRLPAIALDTQDARTQCAASGQVIRDIAVFLSTLPS